MSSAPLDYFVIGGGSGGMRAARMLGKHGFKVALAEKDRLGGTCIHRGCVPKKLLHEASSFPSHWARARAAGWALTPTPPEFSLPHFQSAKDAYTQRIQSTYQSLLDDNGVITYPHAAKLLGGGRISCGPFELSAKKIILATGTAPIRLSFKGAEHFLVSDGLFSLQSLPNRVLLIGSGYIALEFASLLRGLGCEVFLLYPGDNPLQKYDAESAAHWMTALKKLGLNFLLNSQMESCEKEQDGLLCHYVQKGERKSLKVDLGFMAVGRTPKLDELGLENTALTRDARGFIEVNGHFETKDDSVWAIGDIIAGAKGYALTPMAIAQAMHLVERAKGHAVPPFERPVVPTAVFTHPPFGTVGLSEEAAAAQGENVKIYRSEFTGLKEGLRPKEERDPTFIKLVVRKEDETLLGAHMLGSLAEELIQLLAIPITARLKKSHLDQTLALHPTLAEEWVTLR